MMLSFQIHNIGRFHEQYKNEYTFYIHHIVSMNHLKNNSLVFFNSIDELTKEKLKDLQQCIVIINLKDISQITETLRPNNFVITSKNPRLCFAQIAQFILKYNGDEAEEFCNASKIGSSFKCGKRVKIHSNVIIGNEVTIGDDCEIKPGAVINDRVTIGENTVVRENAVIGGLGFGFERDEDMTPIRLPHIGGVFIGKNVEIGALTSVASGTMEPTIIGDYTKIDDKVLIAHNVNVGEKCLIVGGVTISGSVKIGDCCWIGTGALLHQKIEIGRECFIGMGAVVKKSLVNGSVVSDNPAKSLERLSEEKKMNYFLRKLYRKGVMEELLENK